LIEGNSYEEAVELLSNHDINAPCYIIVGGKEAHEGIVITREPFGLNRTESLSDSKWYVAQTNKDWWTVDDSRYDATEQRLLNLTQTNANLENLVTKVLRAPGVL
jgi:hypothetical protein